VLNLPLSPELAFKPGVARVEDPAILVRTAERNPREAVDLLLEMVQQRSPVFADWPDELAFSLIRNPCLRLSFWASQTGLAAWTVSRGFARVFGISPEAFRARARARSAWRAVRQSREPLAKIAADQGFSDQSHMARSVKRMTGMAPQAWRTSANRFKTT
jgi:AraC-like DNA-binding protein